MAVLIRNVPHFRAHRRVVAAVVTLLLTAGILVTVPSVASAADTVINFDDLASGTAVSNQYTAQGITFDQGPSGPADLKPMILSSPGAHSAPNVLDIEQNGTCGLDANRVGQCARLRRGTRPAARQNTQPVPTESSCNPGPDQPADRGQPGSGARHPRQRHPGPAGVDRVLRVPVLRRAAP